MCDLFISTGKLNMLYDGKTKKVSCYICVSLYPKFGSLRNYVCQGDFGGKMNM